MHFLVNIYNLNSDNKSHFCAIKHIKVKTVYRLLLLNTAYRLFLVVKMNYTINTLDQIKPILIGFRKSNGLSQKALAEKLGISQQSYQAIESTSQKVTIERLFKVLSILGVKLQFVGHEKPLSKSLTNQEQDQDEW